MDKIIPLRVPEQMIRNIDQFVNLGLFKNRNEGIRTSIRDFLAHQKESIKISQKLIVAKIISNIFFQQFNDRIVTIVLFGSVAMNRAHDESDIDLLFICNHNLTYNEKLEFNKYLVKVLNGVDEIIQLVFKENNDFWLAVREEFEFESNIYKNGIVLAGKYKR